MTCTNLLLCEQLSVGLFSAPGPSIFLSSSLSPGNGQPPGLPFTFAVWCLPSSSFSSMFLNHGSQTLRDSVFISISQKKIRERKNLSDSTKYITASDFWTTRWVATKVISVELPGEDGIGVSWPTNLYQGTVHGKTVRWGISDPCWSRVSTPRTFCFEKYHGLGLKILLRKQKMRFSIILADSLPALIFWVLPKFFPSLSRFERIRVMSRLFTPMMQSEASSSSSSSQFLFLLLLVLFLLTLILMLEDVSICKSNKQSTCCYSPCKDWRPRSSQKTGCIEKEVWTGALWKALTHLPGFDFMNLPFFFGGGDAVVSKPCFHAWLIATGYTPL